MRETLAERFLRNFSDIFNEMMAERSPLPVEPWSAVLSSLSLAVAISFSKGILAPIIGILLLAIVALRSKAKSIFKVMAIAAAFALMVVGPMALLAGLEASALAPPVLRASAASGFLALGFTLTGQRGFKEALLSLGFRPAWVSSILLFIRFLPVMARLIARSLIAREARIIDGRGRWSALSSVVGDAIVKGHERAWRLRLAMEARGAFLYEGIRPRVGVREAALTACSLAASALILAL